MWNPPQLFSVFLLHSNLNSFFVLNDRGTFYISKCRYLKYLSNKKHICQWGSGLGFMGNQNPFFFIKIFFPKFKFFWTQIRNKEEEDQIFHYENIPCWNDSIIVVALLRYIVCLIEKLYLKGKVKVVIWFETGLQTGARWKGYCRESYLETRSGRPNPPGGRTGAPNAPFSQISWGKNNSGF